MSPKVKNVVLICLAVGLLGAAAWSVFRPAPDAVHPDTPQSITDWMCETCGELIYLTSRQRDEWSRSPDRVRRGDDYDPRQTVFRCPNCTTFTVCRAMKCPQHGVWLVITHSDGSAGSCPECARERPGG